MPSTPTTKSQVQAYKFVLRRMQSALVRRDAVMLHDPMRTHTRATVVGICLAAVGLVGFLVWGLLSSSPTLPSQNGIVISKESGTVYVLLNNPRKLIPTFNLASARLLLLAQTQQAGGGAQPQQQNAATTEVAEPTVVSDKDLQDVPKGRLMGIQDGPQLLPGPDQRISDDWAVCDAYQLDHGLNDPAQNHVVKTTVLAGVHDLGEPLGDNRGLLVQSDHGENYLIYHLTTTANEQLTDTVRAKVNLNERAVINAFNLSNASGRPRHITTALLNAIPEVPPLTAPQLAGKGEQPTQRVHDFTVGTVFAVQDTSSGRVEEDYYVQEKDGIQQIKSTTAQLIRFSGSETPPTMATVRPDETNGINRVSHVNELNIPATAPEVLDQNSFPVACLGWNRPNAQTDGHTTVYVNKESNGVPIPKDKVPPGYLGVPISSPSADHLRVDYFYMPPGRAAVVRGASSARDYGSGPIYLVSDRGVKFGVPDAGTAAALGLSDQHPAPISIVRLLPDGAGLNTRAVLQSYDTVPVGPGTYETPNPSSAPNSPQSGGDQSGGQPGG
ncbi:type VII secretion protein EccB [Labedaea rhizosphaerae]|uniref:Type VII secretion protein EccB n=1 Tax=Labedaea rhizosphaerae TaxID=598644 RepID=A0A4R6SN73_LABRH|nr:type VII secretion protein EccB [Labedaea rhizosphaerae]TDQ05768.1 type VII secretion protein EccB [Labedaea rhizosphaerae]